MTLFEDTSSYSSSYGDNRSNYSQESGESNNDYQRARIAGIIKRQNYRILSSKRRLLREVNRLGKLLAWVKSGLNHGEWSTWLAENTDISQRTATDWMLIAANPEETSAGIKNGASISEVLRKITGKSGRKKQSKLVKSVISIDAEVVSDSGALAIAQPEPIAIDQRPSPAHDSRIIEVSFRQLHRLLEAGNPENIRLIDEGCGELQVALCGLEFGTEVEDNLI